MYFLDLKYLRMISSRLPRFKAVSNEVWNCRCIICGDSQKSQRKARGNFYKAKDSIAYKCHNCGVSMWFSSFLKGLDESLYREYKLEYMRENREESLSNDVTYKQEPVVFEKAPEDETLLDNLMDRLDKLPDDNIAVKYCIERKIPRKAFKKLYFIDDIRKVEQLNKKYTESLKTKEPRIFIPFHDLNGELMGGTMRDLLGGPKRYITVKIKDDSVDLFGLNDADPNKTLYVCEGPLDSLFLDNAIAVGGSALSKIKQLEEKFKKIVYIYDNQPYNKEICNLITRQVNKGDNVVLWPPSIEWKDINDMVAKGGLDVQRVIDDNTYSGIKAKVKLAQWRKC